jgi:hypothetical protein
MIIENKITPFDFWGLEKRKGLRPQISPEVE